MCCSPYSDVIQEIALVTMREAMHLPPCAELVFCRFAPLLHKQRTLQQHISDVSHIQCDVPRLSHANVCEMCCQSQGRLYLQSLLLLSRQLRPEMK